MPICCCVPETLQVTSMGSMTRCSYHSHKSVHLTVFCVLLACLSYRKLTVERGIYFYISVFFYSISHSLEHYIARVFQKLPRFDVVCVDYRTVRIRFSNAALIYRQTGNLSSPIAYSPSTCMEPSLQLRFCTRKSPPRIVCVQWRGADALA